MAKVSPGTPALLAVPSKADPAPRSIAPTDATKARRRVDRFGFDPAFGSGPLATVIQDLLSILIYFAIMTAVMA